MGKRQRQRLRDRDERKQPWESQEAFRNRIRHRGNVSVTGKRSKRAE